MKWRKLTKKEFVKHKIRKMDYPNGGFALWCNDGNSTYWLLDASMIETDLTIDLGSSSRNDNIKAIYDEETNSIQIKKKVI